ncbi:MAG: TonB family protein [Bermanella sp.]
MKINGLWASLAFLTLSLSFGSCSIASELRLNGVASYQELNKEYYIGALLLENPQNNVTDIGAYKERKQMKLLVTADRWSVRLWQQQWQNNIAINNEIIIDDAELQNDLEFFTSFPKGKLVKGDELIIDYTPGRGTSIKLNHYPIIKTNNDKLFTYLLNTWIGKLPPSRVFKNHVLTLNSDSITQLAIANLEENVVSEQRINRVKQWYEQPNKELELAKRNQLESKNKANKKKKIEEAQTARNKLAKARKEKSDQEKQKKEQQVAREKSERLKREKLAAKKRAVHEKAEKAKRVAALKSSKLKKEKEAQLEQYYLKDLYEWQLRQAIIGEVSYPAWAKQFSQEGVVDAQFTISRKGKVLSVVLLDKSVAKMLGLAVDKAIRKSGLKTLPPNMLKGEKWLFSVSYRFDLKDTSQKVLLAPVQPKHMLVLNGKRDSKVVSEYMDKVRQKVIKALKYPAEAVLLKKRGEASVFVTIDRQGNVLKVFEKYKPKHAAFSKALIKAVARAKPLPIMPAGIAKDKLTVDVSYRFSR